MKTLRNLFLPLFLVSAFGAPAFAGETPTRPAAAAAHADKARKVEKADKPEATAATDDDRPEKGSRRARKPALRGTVNLNTADAATLELLPGVGEVKAQKIIDFRHKRPFKKVEDLTRVKGFGRKTLVKLKPYLTISGASTLGETDGAAE